jgi:hypothetical protein
LPLIEKGRAKARPDDHSSSIVNRQSAIVNRA